MSEMESSGRIRGRFTPGVSGNPRGRPRKRTPSSCFDVGALAVKVLEEEVEVIVGGKRVKMPTAEYIARGLVKDAMSGKGPEKITARRELAKYAREHNTKSGFVIEPFSWTEEQEKLWQEIEKTYGEDI